MQVYVDTGLIELPQRLDVIGLEGNPISSNGTVSSAKPTNLHIVKRKTGLLGSKRVLRTLEQDEQAPIPQVVPVELLGRGGNRHHVKRCARRLRSERIDVCHELICSQSIVHNNDAI